MPLSVHAGPSEDVAAVVADHAFFQYERTLQREYGPELIVHLPPAQSLPAAGNPNAVVSACLYDIHHSAFTM